MADYHITPQGDNPALTDPIYADAHKPRRMLYFAQTFTADGEVKTERREQEITGKPASLIVQSVNNQPIKRGAIQKGQEIHE